MAEPTSIRFWDLPVESAERLSAEILSVLRRRGYGTECRFDHYMEIKGPHHILG